MGPLYAIMRSIGCAVLIALAFLVGACGNTGGQPTGSVSAGSGTPTTAAPTATSSSMSSSSSVAAAYRATTVVEGLRIPWEMRFLPNGKLLVTEREGRVILADVTSGAVTEVGRIDVLVRGEGGLMGLALDPDFPATPHIYVSYTHSQGGNAQNRVSRFVLSGLDTPSPRLAGETVLLDGIPAGSIHDGSRVAFGPDGYLWVTTGDSGNGALAQQMDSLAGKVLRMTGDGKAAPGNPYIDRPYPFSLIYTLGHRNPQGLAFHPQTGEAYVTEHGPSDNDEVNKLKAGGNYGWPDLRGKANEPGFIDPIMTWSPTIAPAGALFYSRDLPGDLGGALVLVTLKESDLRVLIPTDEADFVAVAEERVLFDEEFGRLRAIARGPDGALYVATSNFDGRGVPGPGDDRIVRIEPQALSFSDIASSPYQAAILDLASRGVIDGFPDGTFRPESPVTRQQFAKMIVKSLGLPVSQSDISPFVDVGSNMDPTDPLYPDHYVAVCFAYGITQGKTPTTFGPYANMTHAQLITMVARAADLPEPPADYTPPFGDFSPDHYSWARKAAYAGLLSGLQGIGPEYDFLAQATRGEVAQTLHDLPGSRPAIASARPRGE
ncbi:MAG: PQQ-dependent sugar dehydrogenase [bacterium]